MHLQIKMKFGDFDCKNPKKQTRNKSNEKLQNELQLLCAARCCEHRRNFNFYFF